MNEILIYEEIGEWGITAKHIADKLKEIGAVKDITVRVNSPGGNVFDGCTIYNLLQQSDAKVTVVIDGLCASIASVIAMAGDEVIMAENALMMIHDPWSFAVGTADDFRREADLLDKVKTSLLATYEKRTGMNRDEVAALMTDETWLDSDEAITFGFADSTTDAKLVAAQIRKVMGKVKIPESLMPADIVDDNGAVPGKKSEAQSEGKTNEKGETIMAEENVDLDLVKKNGASDALAADKIRRDEISAVFETFEAHAGLMRTCQDDQSCTVADAQAKLLNALGKGESPSGGSVKFGEDGSDKFRDAATAALSARAGYEQMDATNEFRGMTLGEIAKASLQRNGVNPAGQDKMTMIANAFTHSTSDFGSILSNTANKSVLKGWEETEETFEKFTAKGELPDFKAATRVDLNNFPSLRQVRPGAEYKHVTIGDRGETLQLATYGELFSINRQAIINDDLGMFTRVPRKFGRAAKRTVADLVWAQITGNVVMSDGVALFHASHSNLGTAGVITTASVDELRKLMALQKDPDGIAVLNVRPKYMLVPVALQGLATQVIESETEMAANQNNSKRPNYVRNLVEVISDARLDAASTTAWYVAADPAMYDAIEVAYLDGIDQPFLDQMAGWNIDGTEFKVRIDAGVKALDFRTYAKNDGA